MYGFICLYIFYYGKLNWIYPLWFDLDSLIYIYIIYSISTNIWLMIQPSSRNIVSIFTGELKLSIYGVILVVVTSLPIVDTKNHIFYTIYFEYL